MTREETVKRINEVGILPCARTKTAEHAMFAGEVLYDSGIPLLEVPMTVPDAVGVVAALTAKYPDMVVGSGTVLTAEMARRCIDAGARFITSPGLVPEVVELAKSSRAAVLPGALTPSEVIAAWRQGADFVKIFPVSTMGGNVYVRTLKVPFPDIPLIVTGGVNQLTAFEFIQAGANAIGIGSELLPKESLVRKQDYRIRELARRFLLMVQEARQLRATPWHEQE